MKKSFLCALIGLAAINLVPGQEEVAEASTRTDGAKASEKELSGDPFLINGRIDSEYAMNYRGPWPENEKTLRAFLENTIWVWEGSSRGVQFVRFASDGCLKGSWGGNYPIAINDDLSFTFTYRTYFRGRWVEMTDVARFNENFTALTVESKKHPRKGRLVARLPE
ncbi:MAG: hypothetical protein Q7Q71_11360 [Verrucomicrobiota bacterium JB023]|nr:hypothetical protein [Verrucomicrobiota bacterium JB023]